MEYLTNSYGDIMYKSKNSHNQIVSLTFQNEDYSDSIHWNIVLWIGKHSNGYQYLKQTGKDGIKSLIWAKQCIIDFINNVPKDKSKKHYICIGWDDTKRRNIYMWALKDLGFKMNRVYGKLYLCKKL